MVSEIDPRETPSLESMARHCVESGDRIVYIPRSYGWGELVKHLARYDGEWRSARYIRITELGIGMYDADGKANLFPWLHFGIQIESNPS